MASISFDDFTDDTPWGDIVSPLAQVEIPDNIDGVRLLQLQRNGDSRGHLTVLMSDARELWEPVVHAYQVLAEAGSLRAWNFHRRQWDRLSFTNGDFRVVLYDLRPDSPTFGKLNVVDIGEAAPSQLFIPPFVVHGVQNRGKTAGSFVNMPTHPYDPARPDKARLAWNHPGIPYKFE